MQGASSVLGKERVNFGASPMTRFDQGMQPSVDRFYAPPETDDVQISTLTQSWLVTIDSLENDNEHSVRVKTCMAFAYTDGGSQCFSTMPP